MVKRCEKCILLANWIGMKSGYAHEFTWIHMNSLEFTWIHMNSQTYSKIVWDILYHCVVLWIIIGISREIQLQYIHRIQMIFYRWRWLSCKIPIGRSSQLTFIAVFPFRTPQFPDVDHMRV
jgi:hypothetical protein